MPLASFLLLAGLVAPNPLSVSLRPGTEPGPIATATRHPALRGFLLWAVAHIPPNGDLASGAFCTMAAFDALGMPLMDAKARREARSGNTSVLPSAALPGGRVRARRVPGLIPSAVAAGLLHAWFLARGHATLIGPDRLASLRAFG